LVLKAAAEGKIKPEVIEEIRRGDAAIYRVAKEIKEADQREARKEKRIDRRHKSGKKPPQLPLFPV
jgi:hypothetical protein